MGEPTSLRGYHDLVRKNPPPPPPVKTAESELDSLLAAVRQRRKKSEENVQASHDRIEALRKLTIAEFIPVFVELKEKYSKDQLSMEMDASNFLEGGREIRFEFGVNEYRSRLLGTVTTEAIAFHETRYNPGVHGELVSGPMLRLRHLTTQVFREFVCERLTILLRDVARAR